MIKLNITWIAVAFTMTACSFTQKTSVKLFKRATNETYDVIVVPGVPFENGKWSLTMKGRVLWSKYLYDRGITKNIMYSGAAVYTAYQESEIMAMYAESLGIPKEHIFVEAKAEHSTENLYYSYKKAGKLGFEKIALASDPFQTKMLKKFSKKRFTKEIGLIPIVFDELRKIDTIAIDPKIDYRSVKIDGFVPITERQSFRERFRGTRGKNLDFTEKM